MNGEGFLGFYTEVGRSFVTLTQWDGTNIHTAYHYLGINTFIDVYLPTFDDA